MLSVPRLYPANIHAMHKATDDRLLTNQDSVSGQRLLAFGKILCCVIATCLPRKRPGPMSIADNASRRQHAADAVVR